MKKKVFFFSKNLNKMFWFFSWKIMLFFWQYFHKFKNIDFTHTWETFQEKYFCWSKGCLFFHEKNQKNLLRFFEKKNYFFFIFFQSWKDFVFPIVGTFYIFFIKMLSKHLCEVVFFYFFKNTLKTYPTIGKTTL